MEQGFETVLEAGDGQKGELLRSVEVREQINIRVLICFATSDRTKELQMQLNPLP